MKLIIDIPKNIFIKDDLIHFFGCYSQKLDEVIKRGIPLDDIKAEIQQVVEEEADDERWSRGLHYALRIIDKHIGKER